MSLLWLFIASGMALLVFIGVLTLLGGFRLGDCIPLVVIATITFFLSRFSRNLTIQLGPRAFTGLMLFFVAWAVLLGLLRLLQRTPRLQYSGTILLLTVVFVVLALVSGLVNSPDVTGIIATVQVLVIALGPLCVGLLVVEQVGRDRLGFERLVTSFILFCGVLLPVLMLTAAVAPEIFGRLLGWGMAGQRAGAGFARAQTPVGSTIASAMTVSLAYGFALCRFIDRKRVSTFFVLVLCGFAMLFSLSRSTLAVVFIFHLVFFLHTLRRHFLSISVLIMLAVVAGAITQRALPERYQFSRFFTTYDASIDIRFSGIRGAWLAGLKAPVLGHGPGLLYHDIRTSWVTEGGDARRVPRTIHIEGYASPLEPHNVYAYLAAEHGSLGLMVFVAIIVIMWRRTRVKQWQELSPRDQLYGKMYNAQWIAFIIGMYTHSTPLVNMKAAMLFWVFAGTGMLWRECCAQSTWDSHGLGWATHSAPGRTGTLRREAVQARLGTECPGG